MINKIIKSNNGVLHTFLLSEDPNFTWRLTINISTDDGRLWNQLENINFTTATNISGTGSLSAERVIIDGTEKIIGFLSVGNTTQVTAKIYTFEYDLSTNVLSDITDTGLSGNDITFSVSGDKYQHQALTFIDSNGDINVYDVTSKTTGIKPLSGSLHPQIGVFNSGNFIISCGVIVNNRYVVMYMLGTLIEGLSPTLSLPIILKRSYVPNEVSIPEFKTSLFIDNNNYAHICYQYFEVDPDNNTGNKFLGLLHKSEIVFFINDGYDISTTDSIFDNEPLDIYYNFSMSHSDNGLYVISAQTFDDSLSNYDTGVFKNNYDKVIYGSYTSWTTFKNFAPQRNPKELSKGSSLCFDKNNNIQIVRGDLPEKRTDIQGTNDRIHVLYHGAFAIKSLGAFKTPVDAPAEINPCPLPSGSPIGFTFTDGVDTITVDKSVANAAPWDYAIHPITGNIYVVYSSDGVANEDNHGWLDVYDYKTHQLIYSKRLGGVLSSIVIPDTGDIWIYQYAEAGTAVDNHDDRIIIIDYKTYTITRSLYAVYATDASTSLSGFNSIGVDKKGTLSIVDTLVFACNNEAGTGSVLGYDWGNLDTLPTATTGHTVTWARGAGNPSWAIADLHQLPTIILTDTIAFKSPIEANGFLWFISTQPIIMDMRTYFIGYTGEVFNSFGNTAYRTVDPTTPHISATLLSSHHTGFTTAVNSSLIYINDTNKVWIHMSFTPDNASPASELMSILSSDGVIYYNSIDVNDLNSSFNLFGSGASVDGCDGLWVGNTVIDFKTELLIGNLIDPLTPNAYNFNLQSHFMHHPITGDMYVMGSNDKLDNKIRIYRAPNTDVSEVII